MGFFGKIRENLKHGGVKVRLQAPASVSMNDAAVPVTVSITASDEQQNIESVQVEIIAESQNQSFNGNSNNASQTEQHTVARADYAQAFTLAPGETKEVQLSLVMNAGAAAGAQLPQDSGMAQVASVLGKLESVSEAMNKNSYSYTLQASAKIQGIALSPSFSQPVQVLKPGQAGGAINVGVHL